MNRKTRFVTRTALLLAIAIIFQLLGKFFGPQNNFIVGPVVNAVLLIATEVVGVFSGVTISIIAPLVSAITNKSAMAPIVLAFAPLIITGNILLVLCYTILSKKNKIVAVAVAAVVKFAFLYGSVLIFADLMELKPAIAISFTALFSWPQLLTAVVGGIIALAIIPTLKRTIKN